MGAPRQRRLFSAPAAVGVARATRARKTRNANLEFQHQASLFVWVGVAMRRYPELALMHAGAEGGVRDPITGAILKRSGVRPGFPDVRLPVLRWAHSRPIPGLWIEMKAPGQRPRKEQLRVHELLRAQGHRVHTCTDWLDAKELIVEYLNLPRVA